MKFFKVFRDGILYGTVTHHSQKTVEIISRAAFSKEKTLHYNVRVQETSEEEYIKIRGE